MSGWGEGKVVEVDGKTGRAKVEFPDRDGCPSYWLRVNQSLASVGGSRSYSMPEIGAQVSCLLDGRAEDGVILGSTYNDDDLPPVTDPNHIHQDYGGGFVVDIDKKNKTMSFSVPKGTTISAGDTQYVIAPDGVTLNGPKFTVNAPTTFTKGLAASGGEGATVTIDGSMNVSKNVEAGQKVTAGQEVSAPVLRGKLSA